MEQSKPDVVGGTPTLSTRPSSGSQAPKQDFDLSESYLWWLIGVGIPILVCGGAYVVWAAIKPRLVSVHGSQEQSIREDTRLSTAPDLNAYEIMSRCVAAYAGCRSYVDLGVQNDRSAGGAEVAFATNFERDRGFRFEFLRERVDAPFEEDRMVIWGTGTHVRTWWSIEGNTVESMPLPVGTAAAAEKTHGASTTIPDLLMPASTSGLSHLPLRQPTRIGVEPVGTRLCFVLLEASASRETTVWIDTQSFLVRRMRAKTSVGTPSQFETEIVYTPAVNVAIGGSDFEFEPPK